MLKTNPNFYPNPTRIVLSFFLQINGYKCFDNICVKNRYVLKFIYGLKAVKYKKKSSKGLCSNNSKVKTKED